MKTVDFFKSSKQPCLKHNNSNELQKGIKVEREHKGTIKLLKHHLKEYGKLPKDKKIYKSIAKEHLMEDKDYYKKLARWEKD